MASGRASTCGAGSTTAKFDVRQWKKWKDALDIPATLRGEKMKQPKYQAQRLLDQIGDETDSHYIELFDARSAVVSAESLLNLGHLTKEERTEILDRVTSYHEGDLPAEFQVALLLTVLRENPLVDQSGLRGMVLDVRARCLAFRLLHCLCLVTSILTTPLLLLLRH